MKTKALLLAAILFATGSSVCFAANDSNKSDNKDKKECQKDCKKGQKCEGKRCDFNPFEGLNLTESQQSKLNDLRAEFCKKGEKGQKAEGQKMEKGQKGDQQRPDRAQAKREFLTKVKGILTPEQYVTFLENMTVNRHDMGQGRHHSMKKGQMDKKGGKEGRQGKDQNRGQNNKQKESKK